MAVGAKFLEGAAYGVLNDVLSSFHANEGYASPNRYEVLIHGPSPMDWGNGGLGGENVLANSHKTVSPRELQDISINKPTISVVNNAKVEQYQTPDQIKEGLEKQLYSPVRWSEIINYFISKGVTEIIECGPGRVLTGLSKRINKNILATSMDSSDIINQYSKAK